MSIKINLDDMEKGRKTSALPGKIYVTDLQPRSFFCSMQWQDGKLLLDPPTEEPVAVHILFEFPNFGTIWTTLDNCGEGYISSDTSYSLMDELVNSRISRIEKSFKSNLCTTASFFLQQAKRELSGGNKKQALRLGIIAGEEEEFHRATHILENSSFQLKTLLGSTFFGERADDFAIGVGKDWQDDVPPPDFLRKRQRWDTIAQLTDITTLPNFWRWVEPARGKYNFGPLDEIVKYCKSHSIAIKTFTLWWGGIGGQPKWLRSLDLKHQLSATKEWIKVITDRYGEYIQIYEAVNEVHDWQFANIAKYDHKELLELTASVCRWLGEMAPGKPRLINHCLPWGEYAQEYQGDKWVPLTYIQEVLDQGIKFEAIGLQFYNLGRDMMEIASQIDRFESFGKSVVITETAVPSTPIYMGGTETGQVHPLLSSNGWRGLWTEDLQADWVEMFYTIAMARESVHSIIYWDADDDRAFIKNAGFLDSKGNPKPSFHRLMMLKKKYQRSI